MWCFFNDKTKIILNPETNIFFYIKKNEINNAEIFNSYNIKNYPKELKKKVTLLNHFKNYLEPKSNQNSVQENNINNKEINDKPFIHVKNWLRTKHAILFRLNNKNLQVNFDDKTEIFLSKKSTIVTYLNKKGERSTYYTEDVMKNGDAEINKRLNYTKEVFLHYLSKSEEKRKKIQKIFGNEQNDDNKEKEIEITFTSNDQLIKDLKISCKKNDNFSDIKNSLFKQYPDLVNKQIQFLVNGGVVIDNKTIKENKIKNNNHIVIVDF